MKELEVIVQRMIDAGESEEAIASVVKNYDTPGKTSDPVNTRANTGSNDMAFRSESGSSGSVDPDDFKNSQEKNTWIEDVFGKNHVTDFFGDMYRAGKGGIVQGRSLDQSLNYWSKGKNMSDEDMLELVQRGRDMEQYGQTDEMKAFDSEYKQLMKDSQDIMPGDEEGLSGFAGSTLAFMKGWWRNPTAMMQYSSQSLANMAYSAVTNPGKVLAGGVAAAKLGPKNQFSTPTLFISGAMAATSATMETGFTTADLVRESAEENGLNWASMSDKERVDWYKNVANDQKLYDDLTGKALARGLTIGAVDGLTALAVPGATKAISNRVAMGSASTLSKGAGVASGAAVETTGGMLSEVGGQAAAGQEFNAQEILTEGFADKSLTTVEVGKALVNKGPKYTLNGEQLNGSEFQRALKSMDDEAYVSADIKVENSDIMKSVVDNRKTNITTDQNVDSRINNVEDRANAIKLIREQSSLEGNKEGNAIRLGEIKTELNTLSEKYKNNKVDVSIEQRKQAVAEAIDNKFEKQFNKNVKAVEVAAKKKGTVVSVFKTTEEYNKKIAESQGISQQEAKKRSDKSEGVFIGKGEIFIDKQQAKNVGAISVASHEFLHPVLNAAIGDANKQGSIVADFKKQLTSDQKNYVENRLQAYANADGTISQDIINTEYLNLFSDGIQKGEINYDQTLFEKIGEAIKRFFVGEGFDNISFDNGRDVYNFLKEYNTSIKEKGSVSEKAMSAITEAEKKSGVKVGEVGTTGSMQKSITKRAQTFIDNADLFDNKALVEIIKSGQQGGAPQEARDDAFAAARALIERNWPVLSNALKYDPNGNIPMEAVKEAIEEQILGVFPQVTLPNGTKVSRKSPIFNTYNGENAVTTFLSATYKNRQAEIFTRAKAIGGVEQMGVDISEARDVQAKESKKDTSRKARKLNSFDKMIKSIKVFLGEEGEIIDTKAIPFYSDKIRLKIEAKIKSAIKSATKKGVNADVLVNDLKLLIEKDIPNMLIKEFGKIQSKNGNVVIPPSYETIIRESFESILKAYPLARLKKLPFIKKEKIGFTDKKNLKSDNPLLKKDSYFRKDNFKIYKPGKQEFVKYLTVGGLTTLRARQKQFGIDVSGDFVQVELSKLLNDTDYLKSLVDNKDSGIVAVMQAEKLLLDVKTYLDPKTEEKMGGDIVQFSKTAHAINRENKGFIKNMLALLTKNKGIFVRNYINDDPNYIHNTVKEILNSNLESLKITKDQVNQIAKEIAKPWRYKSFKKKTKKYSDVEVQDFLLNNIKLNLTSTPDLHGIHAKLGLKNLKDLNSVDSLNKARLGIKYLFDNLDFNDFFTYLYRSVMGPARIAGFDVKQPIKNIKLLASNLIKHDSNNRDSMFRNKKDIEVSLGFNAKEGISRDEQTYKSTGKPSKTNKPWYTDPNSDYNNISDTEKIKKVKNIFNESKKEKTFFTKKLLPLLRKAYLDNQAFDPSKKITNKNNSGLNLEQIQWIMSNFFGHQFSVGKVMAGTRFLPSDVNGNILTIKQMQDMGLAYKKGEKMPNGKISDGDIMVLEHMMPANYVRDLAYNYILTGERKQLDLEIKNYDTAILPQKQDDMLKSGGVQSRMGVDHVPGVSPMETRYDGVGMYFVDVTDGSVIGTGVQYSKTSFNQQQVSNKAARNINNKNTKGISVFDFDDTLAKSSSEVLASMPDGTLRRLNATEFALQSADLEAAGAVFDFSEFNKVVDGKKGPLADLALKRQDKFGSKDIFVLTARPQEAAYAIHAFLKGIGLEIPVDNITGLEDGRPEAKADWIKDKAAEGYNDFYFADDAYKNVKAVQDMLSGLGLNPNVEQAMQFSKTGKKYGKTKIVDIDFEFNKVLEDTKGVNARTDVSKAQAKAKGSSVSSDWFIPPGAEDFVGLIYQFLGKGKLGTKQLEFFDKHLFKPFSRAIQEMNNVKQAYTNGYQAIKEKYPKIKEALLQKDKDGFFVEDAVRVYIWNKLGYSIPGMSKNDIARLVKSVEKDNTLKGYANSLMQLTQDQKYVEPGENWVAGSIVSDISDLTDKTRRKPFLQEWIDNKNIIFSQKNLNKIESIYGTEFVDALQDMLWRMETGSNRKSGGNKLVNQFMDWVNNSVGAIMFFNMRSAVLQTISSINFINWTDNNPAKAAEALSNFDQYVADFTMIFNSDMLKQRRSGLQMDINEQEIAASIKGKGNTPQALLKYLLTKGFLPTQMADSFAIASGGATMYRNRVNTYLSQGMSKEVAQQKAFQDFAEISEKTQQSARPDLISQQQAGPLGRLILAFQNTPMQYTRLMKKAYLDLVNGRGNAEEHISKIAYYGLVQNLIFTAMQSALFAIAFEDDDDEKEEMLDKKGLRIINNMGDTILRGTGIYGAAASTVKNIILKFREQEEKGFRADHTYTVIEFANLSPPIGSKLRRLYSGIQTYKFNKDIIPEYGYADPGNPLYQAIGNVTAAGTNIPLDRVVNKINNVRASLNRENAAWQRIANFLGWNTWDVGSVYDTRLESMKSNKKKSRKRSVRNKSARDKAYEQYRNRK